jgi:hypothetical protein
MNAGCSGVALAVIFGGIALYALNPHTQPPRAPRTTKVVVTAPPPKPPSPEDVVKTHAPQSEVDFAAVHQTFDDREAPNSIMLDEKLARTSRAWQQAVLGLGAFRDWTGVVREISTAYAAGPRVTVELLDGLRVWATVQPGSPAYATVRGLREYPPQPVVLSGRIVEDELAIVRLETDDIFPTCFEQGLGIIGCEIDLTSIREIKP